MKTVFIINPKSGQGEKSYKIKHEIYKAVLRHGADAEIYTTLDAGDGERYVRNYCRINGPARFIAVGGDGTLNEVLNGAMGFDSAEVGVIPFGTGNDFCRNFEDRESFKDIMSQLNGQSVQCDAIKYTTNIDGQEQTGYCVNMMNIGFDCNVADMTGEMKKKPFISGPFAYFISIFAMLIKKKGADLMIETDGEMAHSGPLLLTSVANGSYCGGGIMSNPTASVQDGFININIVKDVTRFRFITLLPFYMKGTFLKLKGIDKIVTSKKCKKVKITPLTKDFRVSNDGEITHMGDLELEIVHNAFRFVVPSKKGAPMMV